MNRTEKDFWKFNIDSRERRELLLVALLLTVSMFLLNSSFNRIAGKAIAKATEITLQKELKG
ncbi:MAG: hypothetical protein Q3M24_19395 [Candidatus Electrothrix aestuarii]|uniref:Uncharacterized protein n=1 Tax=Candidatus Electrothrix aestuarii TaxID=3062594 RepID=A0AAU8LU83_9BACT|nr:hypothetical protein [Candidatus Electrothrix aestuarii]WPD21085.1 MAG: hypothetical protein SD837_12845 [Candidatus Electrothrix sp. GW3-3]